MRGQHLIAADGSKIDMAALSRRTLIKGGVAAAAGIALPFVGNSSAKAEDKTLTATHFGGPYQILNKIIAAPFKDAGLGEVTYNVEFSGAAIGKMQTQKDNPPFDVALLSRSFAIRAQNAGLVSKIEKSTLTEAASLVADATPSAGWGASMILDTFDLMIDKNQVKAPVESWLDLWKPELDGKLMLPAASNPATVFFLVCIAKAVAGEASSPQAIDEAFAKLKSLKKSVRSYYSDALQPTQLIERGEIAAAPQFGIRIANQSKKATNIVKVTPKEGVVAIPYDLCVPVQSKRQDLARTYINFTLRKDVQSALVSNLLATPVRKDVDITPDIKELVTTEFSKIWFANEDLMAVKQKDWLDRYMHEIQS
jgi:putative spermidine/putrescine transport system substrate-binding protein